MKAFINTPVTKDKFIKHLQWHKDQDAFVRGNYGEGKEIKEFKGCAIGCSINSIRMEMGDPELSTRDHNLYEKYLGVPEWLARIEDTVFEGMDKDRSKEWPLDFAKSINVGADLDKIKAPFITYVLEQNLIYLDACKYDEKGNPDVKSVIEGSKKATLQMIEVQKSGDSASWSEVRSAESAAWTAAMLAESAAWTAAMSAARSAAMSAAWSAAKSAESTSWSVVRSVESAAWSAVRSAVRSAESAAWSASWSAAKSAAFDKYAHKLLELIRECN